MRSSLPKVLHPVCGRPLVSWPVIAAREAGAGRIAVIVSPGLDLSATLPQGTETVVQEEADGTGGAVRAAAELVAASETVVVLSGDHPLISPEVVSALLEAHADGGAAATVMTTVLEDPGSYGRIIRDDRGDLERIVEAKQPGDASPEELAIKEINTGTYAFAAAPLADALSRIENDNAQGEYYLGDVLPLIRGEGLKVAAHQAGDRAVTLGVNNRADLATAEATARARILERHMLAGVTVVDPSSTWVDADVVIAADVRLEPGTSLRGRTEIGEGSVVGPHTTLIDSNLGKSVRAPLPTWSSATSSTNARSGPSPTFGPEPGCETAPRRAPSSRSRTPRSARARRCPTSPMSGTPRSAPARISAPARSPPTTTDRASTGR